MRQSELDKRRTKIVCTTDRATSPMPMIECLIRAGMNVAPLNLGYSTPSEHARYVHSIRNLSKGLHRMLPFLWTYRVLNIVLES